MRAPSRSIGSSGGDAGLARRNVTMRFALGSTPNARYGSAATSSCSASIERTKHGKACPSRRAIAVSARRSSVSSDAARAVNATLPLDSTVLTSVKPADSNAALRSGIFAFIGITPRSNAAYRGIAVLGKLRSQVNQESPHAHHRADPRLYPRFQPAAGETILRADRGARAR